jgi:hypothetical protein
MSCDPLAPETRPCSGHGVCVAGACLCDSGWTGLGDQLSLAGRDCANNELVLFVGWILALIVNVALLLTLVNAFRKASAFVGTPPSHRLRRHAR